MIAAGSLEYAVARMQARLSRRPSEGTWAAIEEARGLVPIFDAARGTSLERLLQVLPPQADLPSVDRAARTAWSRTVAEATAWMPPEWMPALAWCDSAAKPETASARNSTLPLRLAKPAPSLQLADPAPSLPLANPTLLPSLANPAWRRRWPADQADAGLDELGKLFANHLGLFRLALPHEAQALRRGFEARLLALFRRHPVQAAAAFAWLALAALDLERLRGEIERRIAFPQARIAA